jgi:diguanylate cyclase (GGDEF)-like protein
VRPWYFLILLIRFFQVSRFNTQLQKAQEKIKEQRDQLEQLATPDPLTGLKNRLSLDQVIETAQNLFERYGTTWSIILLDLDNFKAINDKHGHLKGDEVLVQVAKTLKAITRKTDFTGRWGGEEFVVVCSSTEKRVP